MKYDFVAIGDITTDAFIRLKDAEVHCDINHEKCEICMRFGDKIPFEDVFVVRAVGNSPNASVAAARLGLKSALVSNLGDDQNGKECIESLKKDRVDTKFVEVHKGRKTNYHYVLWFHEERTILIKHEQYDYKLPDIGEPGWVYLSSLGENSLEFHKVIAEYLNNHPSIKLVFQPGTFQIKLGFEPLKSIYQRSDLFFCNKEESQRILKTQEADIKKLLERMHKLGPKTIVITDGIRGAYAFDGKEAWSMRAYPDPKPPFERTGAGDSFSSTFAVALAQGKDLKEALRWGPVNAMSVVQKVGAQAGLLSKEELEKYLKEAPSDYYPQKM
ncbi:carbohydrate kinase family protein [Candidatus Parcubacteria bacterium]|nr:MAG: carbohydrate kinase family protein [Candidatus Parcubacteria bacterium]